MNSAIFNYNGNNITFESENGGVMANATQMAKHYGKQPSDWTKTKSYKEFIATISAVRNIVGTDLIYAIQGGNKQGTWMHEDVALEFARWLNPRFAIWCNDKIKELLKTGQTQFNNSDEDQAILQAMNILQNRVQLQKKQLQIQAPKVKYVDEVLQSKSVFNTNQIAKEMGMSAITLNRMLQDNHIQYKQNGTWLLYHKYQNKGYTKTKTYAYTDSNGDTKTSIQTVWTEYGRAFLHKFINKLSISA